MLLVLRTQHDQTGCDSSCGILLEKKPIQRPRGQSWKCVDHIVLKFNKVRKDTWGRGLSAVWFPHVRTEHNRQVTSCLTLISQRKDPEGGKAYTYQRLLFKKAKKKKIALVSPPALTVQYMLKTLFNSLGRGLWGCHSSWQSKPIIVFNLFSVWLDVVKVADHA